MEDLQELYEAQEVNSQTPVKKENRLAKWWASLNEEEKIAARERMQVARREKMQEKKEITKATEKVMNKQYRFRDSTGQIIQGNGYEARANAMFKEVVSRGKNMVQADKQLQSYLGEDQPVNIQNNQILVVFSNEEKIDI